jgi:hypothetical protein
MDHSSGQTLAVNATGVVSSEVFKVGGKSTFTDQVTIGGDLLPSADGTKDLGSVALSWSNLYLENGLFLPSNRYITMGSLTIRHNTSHAFYKTTTGDHILETNAGNQLTAIQAGGGYLQYNNTAALT